jgi:hypothetical protein
MNQNLITHVRNVELFTKLAEGNSLSSATRASFTSAKHAAQLSWQLVYTFKLLAITKQENHNYYYAPTDSGKVVYDELVKIKRLINEVSIQHELDFTNRNDNQ